MSCVVERDTNEYYRQLDKEDHEQEFRDGLEEYLSEGVKAVKEARLAEVPTKLRSIIIDLKYEIERLEEYLEG